MHPVYRTNPDERDPQDVLLALRELFSQDRETLSLGAESLAERLYGGRFLPYLPAEFQVEAALEALRGGEGELLP